MKHNLIDIVTDPENMLLELLSSKEGQTVIGINAPVIGQGTYLTCVDDIIIGDEEDIQIVLKGFDVTGYFLEKNLLTIGEIRSVIPFKSAFENPFLKEMQKNDLVVKTFSQ